MDYYACEDCGKLFDEFEMDFKKAQIDKKCLCKDCREMINQAAVKLGKLGGSKTSPRKSQTSRENGKKGGRPRKAETIYNLDDPIEADIAKHADTMNDPWITNPSEY